MGIQKKIFIALLAVAILGSSVLLITINFVSKDYLINHSLQLLQKDSEKYVYEINGFFADIRNDLQTIAPEFEFKTVNGKTGLTHDQIIHIKKKFEEIMDIHGFYVQMRYINEDGNEIVRVDYDKKSKTSNIIPADKLQNKKNRPYFPETMKISQGEFYITPLDLNREGAPPTIQVPYQLVIRYATPLFDDKGDRKGILIANIYADDFLNFLKKASKDTRVYLLDTNGYYLYAQDEDKLWGAPGDLNTGENLKKDFPNFSDKILSLESGHIVGDDIFFYLPINLGGSTNQTFILSTSLPQSVVMAPFNDLRNQVIILVLVISSSIVVLVAFFLRRLLKPLDLLSKTASRINAGDFEQSVPVVSNDEIGKLSFVFNEMVSRLKDSYQQLEEKVNQRTRQLSENVARLEDTKKATLNLLEDIQVEKAKTEEQKNLFSSLIDNSPIGVFVAKAPDGEAIIMNNIGIAIVGHKIDTNFNKKNYSESFHLVDENGSIYPNQNLPTVKALEQGKTFTTSDIFIQKPDDTKIALKVTSAPIFYRNGKVSMCVTVFEDITREKEIDKMKTDFVSIASHQLRSPLVAAKWLLEMLLSKETGELNTQQLEFVNDINTSNQRMIDLVDTFLDVSRIESGKLTLTPVQTNLRELIDEIQKEIGESIRTKKHKFTVNIDSNISVVNIDRKLIKEVYINLLSNAIKYTPPGGNIYLSITLKDDKILSEITDTGYGIPERNQKDIYKKFFRSENIKSKYPYGNGLGLYFVKSIIELSGGQIWFKSIENKGTTFSFTLPINKTNNSKTIQ